MTSFVVSAVTDSCEFLFTVSAVIRLFTGMCAHVYEEVSFLCEDFTTVFNFALKEVLS